jgi:hypothetical protein
VKSYSPVTVQLYTDELAERVVIEHGLAPLVDQAKEESRKSATPKLALSTVIIPTPLLEDGASCLVIIHGWLQHEPQNHQGQEWLVYHITGAACNATRGLALVTRDGLARYHHKLLAQPGCVDTHVDIAMPAPVKPRGGGAQS